MSRHVFGSICRNMPQYAAYWESGILRHIATCRDMPLGSICRNMPQYAACWLSGILRHIAAYCDMPRHAAWVNMPQYAAICRMLDERHIAAYCDMSRHAAWVNMPQYAAICRMLEERHIAAYCGILRHAATCCLGPSGPAAGAQSPGGSQAARSLVHWAKRENERRPPRRGKKKQDTGPRATCREADVSCQLS